VRCKIPLIKCTWPERKRKTLQKIVQEDQLCRLAFKIFKSPGVLHDGLGSLENTFRLVSHQTKVRFREIDKIKM